MDDRASRMMVCRDPFAKLLIVFVGIAGALLVVLAALAAHGLDEPARGLAETAWRMGLLHGVALLALGLSPFARGRLPWVIAGLFVAGILLFSGGLALRALWAISIGPGVPIGGGCFIVGWLAIAVFGLVGRRG